MNLNTRISLLSNDEWFLTLQKDPTDLVFYFVNLGNIFQNFSKVDVQVY
jgi:hypothetical protein